MVLLRTYKQLLPMILYYTGGNVFVTILQSKQESHLLNQFQREFIKHDTKCFINHITHKRVKCLINEVVFCLVYISIKLSLLVSADHLFTVVWAAIYSNLRTEVAKTHFPKITEQSQKNLKKTHKKKYLGLNNNASRKKLLSGTLIAINNSDQSQYFDHLRFIFYSTLMKA